MVAQLALFVRDSSTLSYNVLRISLKVVDESRMLLQTSLVHCISLLRMLQRAASHIYDADVVFAHRFYHDALLKHLAFRLLSRSRCPSAPSPDMNDLLTDARF